MAADDPKLSLQQELERTRGLERDLLTELLTSRRAAWRVAVGSFVIAILSAGALASIFPFQKPPLPYVVRVNDATGEIEHVTQLGNGKEDYGERMDRYFIQQYVLACESYDWNTIQNAYDRCGLFSAPDVQRAYFAKFQDNPKTGQEALDKRYGKHTRIIVSVRSITLGPNRSATVRFTRKLEGSDVSPAPEQLVATLAYRYVNAPMTESVRRENPLGFQVITYTTDVETLR
ncbi:MULTISPECIES: type IV secretion system protein [unclassified Achromobacter]|uniref:virB8 family protein n=1 Tax=unclassified Achromobacter TaxID=2626865 RepID=UPI00069EEB66|nr:MULTISPECIES: type IV secretion system protein [unclassified Achromobacter]KOF55515.1 conjugal transfer protein TraJ [Achromobacter sp. DMS1]